MAVRERVEIEWVAKLEGFQRELAKIKDMPAQQADAAIKALDRQIKLEEKAHKAKLARAIAEEKAAQKAAQEVERAARQAAAAQEKAAKEAQEAQEKAAREAAEAVERAQKEAAESAKRAAEEAERAQREAAQAAERAAREVRQRTEQAVDGATRIASAFGGAIGDVADVAEHLGKGLYGIVGPAGIAAAAVAAVGYAAVQAGRAAVEFMNSATAALERLSEIEGVDPVPQETVDRIHEWERASLAAEVATLKMRTAVAAQLSPAMSDAAYAVAGLQFALDMLVEEIREFNGVVEESKKQSDEFEGALDTTTIGIGHTTGVFGALIQQFKLFSLVGQAATKDIAEQGEVAADSVDDIENYVVALDDSGESNDRAAEAAARLAEAMRQEAEAAAEVNEGLRERKALEAEREAATARLLDFARQIEVQEMSAEEQARARYEERLEFINEQMRLTGDLDAIQRALFANEIAYHAELARIRKEGADEERQRQKEEADRAAQTAREIADAKLASFNAIAGGASQLADLVIRNYDRMGQGGKEAALLAFRVQQAAGLAQVAVNTAVAVTRALAELGPIAGPIAAGGIIATGAVQAAIIASEPPPKLHTGFAPSAAAPDEFGAVLRNRESVLNQRATEDLGPERIRALNEGRGMGAAPARNFLVIDDRVIELITAKVVRSREFEKRMPSRPAGRRD